MNDRRINLIANLVRRQAEDTSECPVSVSEAVRILLEDLLCDTKFDRSILHDLLTAAGWTEQDIEYFGIGDMLTETD